MKKILTILSLVLLMMLFLTPSKTYAADTLVVFATQVQTLDQVINNDTTASGIQKHVYKLVSLDTTYIFSAAITVKSDLTIIGIPGTDGRPPCIQPDVLPDGSIPATLFVMNGNNTTGTFKNLYLMGLSLNGSPAPNTTGIGIQVSGDNININVDNCVFEEWRAFAIGYNGNWDSFFITNSKFRNTVDPTQQYEGEVLRCEYPGSAITDSIVMKWNTFIAINCYAAAPVTKFYNKYFEFSHNTIMYGFKNPFFIFNVTDAKINDNIFYANWVGGISKTEYPWWDQLWSPEVGSIIDLDTLDLAKDSVFNPGQIGDPNFRLLSEQKRTIEVKNNVCFWPSAVTNFWTSWNDTATVDSIYTPTWMNARTTNMFANSTTWPGLVESGNLFVDPVYGPSIVDVLTNTSGVHGVGLFNYFRGIRTGTATTDIWGYKIQTIVQGTNWIPEWPLPETNDLKYTNSALLAGGTDGLPIGDPWWFYGYTGVNDAQPSNVPNQFTLSEAYPNPFNPSTTIKFNLVQAGKVSLKVYNVMGQLVKTVVDNEFRSNGESEVQVRMDNLTSGVYFYTLTQGNNSVSKKMMLLK